MKSRSPLSTALASACCSVCAAAAGAPPNGAAESPVSCDPLALDPPARKRHFEVLVPELVAGCIGVEELADGYELVLPSDQATYAHVTEWMNGERRCCPFLDISVRAMPEHGPLKVRITGRPDVKVFLQSEGANWLRRVVTSK